MSESKVKTAITETEALVARGLVPTDAAEDIATVAENFRIRIPAHILSAIDTVAADDPLARQFVPDVRELETYDGEMDDPIGDGAFERAKGVTHRYPDRVLLKPTHACQVYCRFCFRRETVGEPEAALDREELAAALDYIRAHGEIWEVILSGGDPLVLSDRRLAALMLALGQIDHVAVIRIHTRAPLVTPERIIDDLVAALKQAGKTVNIVIHVNHPRELTEAVRAGLARLADGGIPLFAQTVLLKGINDEAETLATLFKTLVVNRVKPYYLHHLDKAKGVAHFAVPISRGQALMRALQGTISGLCLPTYVLDIPGGQGKAPIGPCYLEATGDGEYRVTDYQGGKHSYSDWR
ncbi:lysine-2,3-aminomutase-like protein [Martelella soudanensis]|uniref:lysine-2,3-aminomutase-like protein n=1 Tax=unclassified Martelella TaxID=2629616 RepID=UPI0015DE385A|nr:MULTISPECIES: lysine-2,3-aminomutase-like protein [unclassified Martelella]